MSGDLSELTQGLQGLFVRAVAFPVLRHRIVTTFNADAEGITTDDIIRKLLQSIPVVQAAVTIAIHLPKGCKVEKGPAAGRPRQD